MGSKWLKTIDDFSDTLSSDGSQEDGLCVGVHNKAVIEDSVLPPGGIEPMEQDLLLISDAKRERLDVMEVGENSRGQELPTTPSAALHQASVSRLPKPGGHVEVGVTSSIVQCSTNMEMVGAGFQTHHES